MYVLALSDYKQPAAAAGYKPAPQLNALFMSRRDYASLYPLIARHIR